MIGKLFFYLALLSITFDGFPYYKFGLGSTKALAIVPLIIFLFFNIHKIVRRKYKVKEIIEILMIAALLSISYFKGKYVYNDLEEFTASINMFAIYLITIFAFKIFFDSANKRNILILFKCIYRSFDISLVYGILELIYFYKLEKSDILYEILNFFLRDNIYLLGKRMQFNFSEPGSVGIMIVCIYIPTLYILKKLGYKFSKFEKVKIALLFVLTIFTKSVTYYLMILVLLILLFFYKSKSISKKVVISVLGISLLSAGYTIINSDAFISYSSRTSSRFIKILSDPSYLNEDNSSQVRIGLWKLSIYGAKDEPVIGYGWGYFKYALRNNYDKLDSKIANNPEMMKKLTMNNQQTYSIYSTCLVEGGIVAIVWLIIIIYTCIKNTHGIFRIFLISLLISFMQIIFIYNVATIAFLQIYLNKELIEFIERKSNNEEDYMFS